MRPPPEVFEQLWLWEQADGVRVDSAADEGAVLIPHCLLRRQLLYL